MEDQLTLEQRVWQRVRGTGSDGADPEETLARLIRLGREQTAALRYLDRNLWQQERDNLVLNTALYRLRFGKTLPGHRPVRPSRQDCRRRAAAMLQLYLRLENHRELGALFTDLTGKQRAICAALEHMQ